MLRLPVFLVVILSVAGCAPSAPPGALPAIEARPVTLASGETVQPMSVVADSNRPLLQLTRIQFDVPRGKEIGLVSGYGKCDGVRRGPIYHTGGRSLERPREWQDTFRKVMTGHGYRVPNEGSRLFTEVENDGADIQVGASIIDFHLESRLNCNHLSEKAVGLRPKTRITIDWQIYDPVRRTIIGQWEGEGVYESETVLPLDAGLPMQLVFADALNRLAAEPRFRDLVVRRGETLGGSRIATSPATRRSLARDKLFDHPIAQQIDHVRNATVLIENSAGHGSGFFISADGLIVTNSHVVGADRFVRVRMLSGQTVTGEVIQRHGARDVALVKIEGARYPALPVRETPAKVTEEVYAIGAPQTKQLGWTVTRGVVSAFRPARPPAQLHDLIQADVPIHGGNSGGPLLDRQGNLVGIAVLGWAGDETKRNTSLNGFVPILDGLDKLGLDLVDPAEFERRRKVAASR